jgi:hypothetical protein
MASKRKSLPSIAFHPIQALDGVKCGVKWPFYSWQKINKLQSLLSLF